MSSVGAILFKLDLDLDSLTWLHWVGIGLAGVTGGSHVYMYVVGNWLPVLATGVGFYLWIVLVVFGVARRGLYAIGILYTGVQILWFYAAGTMFYFSNLSIEGYFRPPISPPWLGLADKFVQASLVIVLIVLLRSSLTEPSDESTPQTEVREEH